METIKIKINNLDTHFAYSLTEYVKWSKLRKNQFEYPSGIYIIVNNINNKKYIGSTYFLKRRIKQHLYALNLNKHSNKKLQNSFNKYGISNFSIYLFPINISRSALFDLEMECIKNFNSIENGYNLVLDSRCIEWSEEQKKIIGQRMSKINKGIPKSKEHKLKCSAAISIVNSGEGNPSTKLCKEDILFIRNNYLNYSIQELSDLYKVKKNVIRSIIHLRTFNYPEYIPDNYVVKKLVARKPKFDNKTIQEIKKLALTNKTYTEIATIYHCSRKTIANICNNKYAYGKN